MFLTNILDFFKLLRQFLYAIYYFKTRLVGANYVVLQLFVRKAVKGKYFLNEGKKS